MVNHQNSKNVKQIQFGLVEAFFIPNGLDNALLGAVTPNGAFRLTTEPSGFGQNPKLIKTSGGADPSTAASATVVLDSPNTGIAARCTLRLTIRAVPMALSAQGAVASLANGPFYDVIIEYDCQSSQTLAAQITALKGIFNVALAGTGSLSNGRTKCVGLGTAQKADYATGLGQMFAPATGTSPSLTFNALSALGASGNGFEIFCEVIHGAPTAVNFGIDDFPILDGVLGAGYFSNIKFNNTATKAKIASDQAYASILEYITELTSEITMDILQTSNIDILRQISNITALASSNVAEIALPNASATPLAYGLVMRAKSKLYSPNNDYIVVNNILGVDLNESFGKTATPAQAKFSIQASTTGTNLYKAIYQPSINS